MQNISMFSLCRKRC